MICDKCAEEYSPPESIRNSIGLEPGIMLKRGKGCRSCRGTGYKGRAGVFEVLYVTEELRNVLIRSSSIDDIRRVAVKQGMVTLRENTLTKVRAGLTTPEEMLKVTLGVE
jgi:type II secretory ATPase GspE/PulE/Tfp pilus assembly ATPase PilB-like protein